MVSVDVDTNKFDTLASALFSSLVVANLTTRADQEVAFITFVN